MKREDYARLIGSLRYTADFTLPGISFSISQLGRFFHNNDDTHLAAAKRVLNYLVNTKGRSLYLRKDNSAPIQIRCYSDSIWADTFDRRTTIGHIITIINVVKWKINVDRSKIC
jgi:hypothetical protein